MRHERSRPDDGPSGTSGPGPLIAGLSQQSTQEFCDALEFGMRSTDPSDAEQRRLRKALDRLASEAHAATMRPEQFLLAIRHVWKAVCQRDPTPDMHDAAWDLTVQFTLDAYEAERARRHL